MKSKFLLIGYIFILSLTQAQAQVTIALGDITGSRSTSKPGRNGFVVVSSGELQVELKLHGDAVATARSVRMTVTSAVDDTGADLTKPRFDGMDLPLIGNSPDLLTVLDLKEPAAGAKAIKVLTGEAELFEPQDDPASTVTVQNFQKTSGSPISSPVLAAAGVTVTVTGEQPSTSVTGGGFGGSFGIPGLVVGGSVSITGSTSYGPVTTGTSEESAAGTPAKRKFKRHRKQNQGGPQISVTLKIADPQHKIVSMEFQDTNGQRIADTGRSSFEMFGNETKSYHFASPFPDTARLVIYLSTPKSYVKVPFSFMNIALPASN